MEPLRALILSGGGGRGGFHAGVYKYLSRVEKSGVDAAHSGAWTPQVIVGTSIGAVNGAAITMGMSAAELEAFWLSLREKDIHGLPPDMRGLAKWAVGKIFGGVIMDARLKQVPAHQATSPKPVGFWPPMPILPGWLADKLVGHWINFLDTGPLRQTLLERMKFSPEKLAASEKTLLISATKVETGERVMFSNKPVKRQETGQVRTDILPGITVDRVLASCSIPLVYPWTFDAETQAHYWDGAVVANTPLGSAFDAFDDPSMDRPVEVLVVLMTPWWPQGAPPPQGTRQLPASFGDAVTWALDWALLASFRERLKIIEAFNRLAEEERLHTNPPYKYRKVKVMIAAPERFIDAGRIIDYDEKDTRELIALGESAAERVFMQNFGAFPTDAQ
jgi:NTE family protein